MSIANEKIKKNCYKEDASSESTGFPEKIFVTVLSSIYKYNKFKVADKSVPRILSGYYIDLFVNLSMY